jgi:hypothetical protein
MEIAGGFHWYKRTTGGEKPSWQEIRRASSKAILKKAWLVPERIKRHIFIFLNYF